MILILRNMKYGVLQRIILETGQSPENLSDTFGVANMTIRRWMAQPPRRPIPAIKTSAISQGILKLIETGRIAAESRSVQDYFRESASVPFLANLEALGWRLDTGADLSQVLKQIGKVSDHQKVVNGASSLWPRYRKLGTDWREKVDFLLSVLKSRQLTNADKAIAFGALFYLLSPIDLIPDHIPVVGLLDDFGILAMALAYYRQHYPILSRASDPE